MVPWEVPRAKSLREVRGRGEEAQKVECRMVWRMRMEMSLVKVPGGKWIKGNRERERVSIRSGGRRRFSWTQAGWEPPIVVVLVWNVSHVTL